MLRLMEEIRQFSREFYNQHKKRVFSIVLFGSFSRSGSNKEEAVAPADADIILVTRSFLECGLANEFKERLSQKNASLTIDAGILPLKRLVREKSLLAYDIKYSGKILAGEDIRQEMPNIAAKDLYPFEPFRLLLNRAVSLIESIDSVSSTSIRWNDAMSKTVAARILRAYVDSCLLFNRVFFFANDQKREAFRRLTQKEPLFTINSVEDARLLILDGLSYGLKSVQCDTFEDLIELFKKEFKYHLAYRFATFARTRNWKALMSNPIFEAYTRAYKFLDRSDMEEANWEAFKEQTVHLWRKSPQPIIMN
jgi:hypothetical protein